MGRVQQAPLGEVRADDLQAHRQPGREAGRDADAGQRGQVHRDGAQVGQVHGQRVGRALPDLEGHGGRGGRDQEVEAAERLLEVLDDERAGPLRLGVVGVVVAGGEGVGADHDAALDLGAEALAAGAHVHLVEVFAVGGAVTVAHPVEAGQVGAGLRRRDEVVGGDAPLHAGQAHLFADPAQRPDGVHRGVEHLAHARLAGVAHELLDDPEAQPLQVAAARARRPAPAARCWWSRAGRARR